MNLFELFHRGVLARLNADSFFRDAPAIVVLGEDMPNTRQLAATQRTTLGIVGICSKPDFNRIEGDIAVFRCSLGWFENQKQNMEGDSGAKRSGSDCVIISTRLLNRFPVPVSDNADPANVINPFSPIRIKSGEYVGEEDGVNVWELQFETSVPIEGI